MFILREEQMDTLRLVAARGFEERMVIHLWKFFPEECRRAGDARIRGTIQQGIFRAGKYGITNELDVARYIDLSVVLGLDFDSGKRHPWAPAILNDPEKPPAEKMLSLQIRTQAMREGGEQPRVIGPTIRRTNA